jgi:hypothetical protein
VPWQLQKASELDVQNIDFTGDLMISPTGRTIQTIPPTLLVAVCVVGRNQA